MAVEGNIQIGLPGSVPTPPAGEVTRFFDTTFSPPKLSYKDETGAVFPYPFSSSSDADDCCCEIAEDMMEKISCGIKDGMVSMSDFETFVKQGVTISSKSTDDGAGNKTCNVTISPLHVDATGLTVSPSTLTMSVGSTQVITAILLPTNATDRTIIWSSSNSSKATVSSTGVVTAIASGTSTITATSINGLFTATCAVTVS